MGRVKLAENLPASPFNKKRSNEATFSLIHLAFSANKLGAMGAGGRIRLLIRLSI
jgi:hypothetical protein